MLNFKEAAFVRAISHFYISGEEVDCSAKSELWERARLTESYHPTSNACTQLRQYDNEVQNLINRLSGDKETIQELERMLGLR